MLGPSLTFFRSSFLGPFSNRVWCSAKHLRRSQLAASLNGGGGVGVQQPFFCSQQVPEADFPEEIHRVEGLQPNSLLASCFYI